MLKINLLPLKIRKTKGVIRLYTYLVIAGSLAAIVLVMVLLNVLAQTRGVEKKIADLHAAEAALADKTGPLLSLARQEEKIVKLKAMIGRLTQEQPIWIKILDELANVVQDDMWLTKLLSERQAGKKRLVLTLEGEAYHKISVADFLTMLENSDFFTEVTLEALNETQRGNRSQVQFKLKMHFAEVLPMEASEEKEK
ncbi:PilN domain-containing protein [bacterium]|nr:PilN domain-containing protein [bacterium]